MVPWAAINTFIVPFGIFALRNGTAYYRSIRATYHLRKKSIQSPSARISVALNVLFGVAVLALLLSIFPYFSPPNVFRESGGRLQTPTEIIFNNLAALRPLTALDEALRPKLGSKETRLYYFAYGPQVVGECPFCSPDDPMSYLYYALPSILTPHIIHIIILGLVTSSYFTGYEGGRWRTYATFGGAALAVVELYWTMTYDVRANTRSTSTANIDFFFEKARLFRALGIAAVDATLGLVMWLAATNRFFISPPTVAQRIEAVSKAVEASNFRLWTSGNVRNTVVRDRELRERVARYWNEDKGVFEEREVVDAIRSALTRTDMGRLAGLAEQVAADVMNALRTSHHEQPNGQPP